MSTIGAVAVRARCPGRNGAEGGQAMNGSTKDLTSSARFESAIPSRAELSTYSLATTNPGSDETVLKTLVFVALQRYYFGFRAADLNGSTRICC